MTRRQRQFRSNLHLELLERRHLLAAITFVPQPIVSADDTRADVSLFVDLDGDQDTDLLSAVSTDGESHLKWLPNVDGQFSRAQILWTDIDRLMIEAFDGDADGDRDILVANDSQIFWLENVDGRGSFRRGDTVAAIQRGVTALAAADVDADGDIDVLFTEQLAGELFLSRRVSQGFAARESLAMLDEGSYDIALHDMDGDRDVDVVASSIHDGFVAWFENRAGMSWQSHEIVTMLDENDGEFAVGDIDADGDFDVVAMSMSNTSAVDWYENNGAGVFTTAHGISIVDSELRGIVVADADRDGDLDVVTASNQVVGGLVVHINRDGRGQFDDTQSIVIAEYAVDFVQSGDINGDSRLELVAHANGDVLLFEPIDAPTMFHEKAVVLPSQDGTDIISHADMDADGDLDLVVGSEDDGTIEWYENSGGQGFVFSHTVAREEELYSFLMDLVAGDVDADGDLDVVAATVTTGRQSGTLIWYENTQGGTQFTRHEIEELPLVDTTLLLADLDRDGDSDLLVTRQFETDSHIIWLENRNGLSGATIPVAQFGLGTVTMATGDVDGDGDVDVLSSFAGSDGQVLTAWHKNLDGNGTFVAGGQLIAASGGIGSLTSSDIDADGDQDIVVGTAKGGIVWYDNSNGQGLFLAPRTIADDSQTNEWVGIESADLDRDGDQDLVARFPVSGTIVWYEHTSGRSSFGPPIIVARLEGVNAVTIADLDGDGDLDLAAGSNLPGSGSELSWFENRLIGDVNDDGQFDSSDLVRIFQAGQYFDGIARNSQFEDGDWDGDGEFDSADLVSAFQSGRYQAAASPKG